MKKPATFSLEVQERAVRMVVEARGHRPNRPFPFPYSYRRFKDAEIVVQTTAVAKDHADLLQIK